MSLRFVAIKEKGGKLFVLRQNMRREITLESGDTKVAEMNIGAENLDCKKVLDILYALTKLVEEVDEVLCELVLTAFEAGVDYGQK